jgi:hypothetical protein
LLRLVNVDTQVGSTKTANESGDYLYLNLTPGTYTLEAFGPRFQHPEAQPLGAPGQPGHHARPLWRAGRSMISC